MKRTIKPKSKRKLNPCIATPYSFYKGTGVNYFEDKNKIREETNEAIKEFLSNGGKIMGANQDMIKILKEKLKNNIEK